jgi:hypothetical protein
MKKYIYIGFANNNYSATENIRDIRRGVTSAVLNLNSRHGVILDYPYIYKEKVIVEITIPDEIAETWAVGPHLKGISNWMLKNYPEKYKPALVGNRLLTYVETPCPFKDNASSTDNYLILLAQMIDLLQRRDPEALQAINKIKKIVKGVNKS